MKDINGKRIYLHDALRIGLIKNGYEINKSDVGDLLSLGWGTINHGDVGKRVYIQNNLFYMENSEQVKIRKQKEKYKMDTKEITNNEDVLDSRDIFARIEKLESERDDFYEENEITPNEIGNPDNEKWVEWDESESAEELKNLSSFMEEFCGYGGDEKWRGSWYPVTIIRESYFTEYTKELLEDCGYIPKDFPSWIALDWDVTAENVKVDYSSAEFDGVTYWAR